MKKLLSLMLVIATLIPCIGAMATPVNAAVTSSNALLPFEDVPAGQWFAPHAEFCYANEVINGQGNTYTFAPNANLTRATFVVMLARVMKADLSSYNNTVFNDCPAGSWYTPSVMWAFNAGYANGTGNGNFSPNKSMTREEAAVMFTRVLKESEKQPALTNTASSYTDLNKVSNWALDGVKYIIDSGIMGSTSTNKLVFSPKTIMTRAQIAKMINVFMVDYLNSWCVHRTRTEPSCVKGDWCRSCGIKFTLPLGHKCNSLSCVNGDTCTVCGEYVAADKGLHNYTKGSCTQAEKCTICGDIRKEAPGHNYSVATCTAPAKCSRCGDIKQNALGHDYTAHTCTSAKKCKRCGYQAAPALGHTTNYGICTRCNSEIFGSEYSRLCYYFYTEGLKSGNGIYYLKSTETLSDGSYGETKILYDINKTAFTIKYYIKKGTQESYVTIDIPKKANLYNMTVDIYLSGKNVVPASGTINPVTTVYDLDFYNYSSSSDAFVKDTIFTLVSNTVFTAEEMLNNFHSSGLHAFGFELYS
ncbi:MAG: S-layer homology domain-containing protein [Ruminococcaceae bacterium]|nr:S-layer homology domain-containing protein [Oscillospiraceae bacterium]